MMRIHLIAAATLAALSLQTAAQTANAQAKATVAVTSAADAGSTSLEAVVEAVRQTTLSAQVPGAIVAVLVRAGDRVQAGQALVRIDARAAQQNVAGSAAQVEAAVAALNVAATELERQKQLLQKQYISQAALDRAQAQWLAAQAQVKALQAQTRSAETQSGFHVLNAPYSGVVSELSATLGDMAMPGRPLLVMHDPSALRVVAAVPQTLLGGLADKLAAVRYELPGAPVVPGQSALRAPAQTQLLPTIDPATHTAQIRLMLLPGSPGVTPGMFARVWLPAGTQAGQGQTEQLFLPAAAIVRRGEMTGVYVVDAQGQARLRQVRLGRTTAERVEVLSGVSKGEQVLADPKAATPR
ncbi:MAG: Toluene efflux pump periplasmic linker protein TtgG precursor [Pseudomonadota bacterium]|jgi:RND family efflux transporter MFP subunit